MDSPENLPPQKPSPSPEPESPLANPKKLPQWVWDLIGMVVGNVVTAALYAAVISAEAYFINRIHEVHGQGVSVFIAVPSLFLIPYLGGWIASYFWCKRGKKGNLSEWNTPVFTPKRRTTGRILLNSLFMTLMALLGGTIAFHEGIICLLIVSPLYYLCIAAGAACGRLWFYKRSSHLRMTVIPLLILVVMLEPSTRMPEIGVVTDRVLIHAPPSKVWPCVTAFPKIPNPPTFWMFRLGLPYPEATTNSGDFPGADRACIFSDNDVFKEKVAEIVPEKKLVFDIIDIPKDPELLGHLTPTRGEFILKDNHDGTTTLIGSSYYMLHVRPLWYFDWWTHYIFSKVHLRVMDDIRRRAEIR